MADEAQLKVRLLRSLKAKVDNAARDNRRTLNAEIVARLERTFIEDAERANLAKDEELAGVPDFTVGWASEIERRLNELEAAFAKLPRTQTTEDEVQSASLLLLKNAMKDC